MRRYLLLFVLCIPFVGLAYEQQGFSEYKEEQGVIQFTCPQQCIILVGPAYQYDMINIKGQVNGEGVLGYGFAIGNQIIPANFQEIHGYQTINQDFVFSENQAFKQIPANAQLVILMQGNIQGKFEPIPDTLGLSKKISSARKSFWTHEPYGFYSINLLYGPQILGDSATKTLSIRLIIISIILFVYLFIKKQEKKFKKYFVYTAVFFFGLLGLRFVIIDEVAILKNDYKTFISQPDQKKIFRNYGDIYAFVQFIKQEVKSGSKINFISYQVRPFPGFSEYQLWPSIQFDTGANILAVYDIGTMRIEGDHLVKIENGQILYTGVYDIRYFSPFSFVAKK